MEGKAQTIDAQCVNQKNDERGKEWGEIVEIYRKYKKNRSVYNIGQEQNVLEEQKKGEDSRRR